MTQQPLKTVEQVLQMLRERKSYIRFKISSIDERDSIIIKNWEDREKEIDLQIDRITGKEQRP
jgi:selenophosphate synthetase-related protein